MLDISKNAPDLSSMFVSRLFWSCQINFNKMSSPFVRCRLSYIWCLWYVSVKFVRMWQFLVIFDGTWSELNLQKGSRPHCLEASRGNGASRYWCKKWKKETRKRWERKNAILRYETNFLAAEGEEGAFEWLFSECTPPTSNFCWNLSLYSDLASAWGMSRLRNDFSKNKTLNVKVPRTRIRFFQPGGSFISPSILSRGLHPPPIKRVS